MDFCDTSGSGKRDFIWEGISVVNLSKDEKSFDSILIPGSNANMIIDSELFLMTKIQ